MRQLKFNLGTSVLYIIGSVYADLPKIEITHIREKDSLTEHCLNDEFWQLSF